MHDPLPEKEAPTAGVTWRQAAGAGAGRRFGSQREGIGGTELKEPARPTGGDFMVTEP